MTDLDGVLRRDGGDRLAVRFERRYGAGPAELWSALTEPDRLRRWLGAEVVGADVLGPGGEFTLRWEGGDDQIARCRVLIFDAPRTFELTWSFTGEPDSVLRFDLAAADGGTVLTLDHRLLPPDQASGYAAGWHAHLDTLADDTLPPWDDRFMGLWPAYKEQLAALPAR
jgi:uncharacterized protein YndB with AHSA1/START domain